MSTTLEGFLGMYAKVRGTQLYFDVEGAGMKVCDHGLEPKPVLLLLHGGPGGDHASFRGAMAALADTVQLIYLDHRGSGRSQPCDPATYTLDENIDDVAAFCQYLGLNRVSILGQSYGGIVAQGVAIRYPDLVSNLILSATAPSHRTLDQAKAKVAERGTPEQQRVCQWLFDGTFQSQEQLYEFYRLMGPWYSTTFDAQRFEVSWRQGIRNFEQLNLGFAGFLRTFDFTEQLASIRCPTLVLAGRHDWICPVEQSYILAERIPRAQLKVFEHSAHSIAADENAAYLAAVRGFMTYPAA